MSKEQGYVVLPQWILPLVVTIGFSISGTVFGYYIATSKAHAQITMAVEAAELAIERSRENSVQVTINKTNLDNIRKDMDRILHNLDKLIDKIDAIRRNPLSQSSPLLNNEDT